MKNRLLCIKLRSQEESVHLELDNSNRKEKGTEQRQSHNTLHDSITNYQ